MTVVRRRPRRFGDVAIRLELPLGGWRGVLDRIPFAVLASLFAGQGWPEVDRRRPFVAVRHRDDAPNEVRGFATAEEAAAAFDMLVAAYEDGAPIPLADVDPGPALVAAREAAATVWPDET